MEIVPTVLSVLLALAFLGAGLTKIAGPKAAEQRADITRLGLPPSATPVIGLIEVVAAALLIAAVISDEPGFARVGAAMLVLTMLGAVAAHLRVRDSLAHAAPAAVLGVLAVVTLVVAG
jgi:putative oxidoreductase